MKTATITIFIALALFAAVANSKAAVGGCFTAVCSAEDPWACGTDGRTYANRCFLINFACKNGISDLKKAHDGACK